MKLLFTAMFLLQFAAAQGVGKGDAAMSDMTPQEESALREAGKKLPPDRLEKYIREIKDRRHPSIYSKAAVVFAKLLFGCLAVAFALLILPTLYTCFWSLKSGEYLTFSASTFSILVLLVSHFVSKYHYPPGTPAYLIAPGAIVLLAPLIIRLIMLKPTDIIFDVATTVAYLALGAAIGFHSLRAFWYAGVALALVVVLGEIRAIILWQHLHKEAAAHCIAYAAVNASVLSLAPLAFIGL